MADPREVERIRNKLDGLRQKLANNEIGLPEYSAELQTLQRRLKEEQAFETQLIYKNEVITPGESEAELARDVSQALEGRNVITPYRYTEEFVKEGVPREEAFERGKQKFRTELAPQRYGTGEFIESIPSTVQVSNVIDPVKGLIQDPSTGEIRKGTTGELLYSAFLERQRKPTELTTAEAISVYNKKYEILRRRLIEQKKSEKQYRPAPPGTTAGLYGVEVETSLYDDTEPVLTKKELDSIDKEIEQEMSNRIDLTRSPEAPAVISETGLDYGLRQINAISGIVEPLLLRPAQELFGFMIGSGGPTIRKGAGYKETEIDQTGGQALTNLLTGQGSFTQVQSSLLPPDENVSSFENFLSLNPMRQGTLGSGLPSLGPELLTPITPIGPVKAGAKLTAKGIRALSKGTKAQAVARTVESPLEQIRYMGARSEIDAALRSVDENLKAADIEKQIAKNGGTINRPTLRKKAAETIGDIYGSHKEAIALGKAARSSIDEAIRPEMFTNPNSGYVRGLFGKKKSITPEELQSGIQKMDEVFDGAAVTGKNERVVLRRTKQVADDVEANLTRGQKPLRDVDIVNRSVNKTKMEDLRFWHDARLEGRVPDDAMKLWNEGYELLTKQRTKPLIPDEIIRLGKVFDSLQQKGVWKVNDLSFKPSDIYSATRNAVSDVMRDNFLKNIADDFIYVNRTVAVPYKNYIDKSLKNKLNAERRFYMESKGGNFTSEAGRRIKLFQRRTGFTLPGKLQVKLNKLAKDEVVAFTYMEKQLLTDTIEGELALNILDGVRLKTGTFTSQMADIPSGALRQTLVKSGQAPTSSVIMMKSIVNAVRLMFTKGGTITRGAGKISEFFKLSDDAPPMFRQFEESIVRAHNSAKDEVLARISSPGHPDSVKNFDDTLESYIRKDIEIQQQSRIQNTQRVQDDMDIAPTARSEFSGDVDYQSIYQPRLEKLQADRQKIIDTKANDESVRLFDNYIRKVVRSEKILEKTYKKDLQRIVKKYTDKETSLKTKQSTVSTTYTKKGTQTKRRFAYARERKALKKQYDKDIALHKNQYEAARKLLNEATQIEEQAIKNSLNNIKTLPKIEKIQNKTNEKIASLQQRIDQVIDKKVAQAETKSERVAVNRKLLQLSDKYGRDNVTDFLTKQMDIDLKNIKYEDFVKQIDFLEKNMEVVSEQIYRASTWKSVVEGFFKLPPNVKDIPARWKDNIYDLIRIDKKAPYWKPNNIKPLTLDNYKEVIEELRKLNPAMRNYGLQQKKLLLLPGEEDYVVPLAEKMFQIQRTENMALQIDDFIARSPDMFVNLERSQSATLGLESTKEIAEELVVRLKNTAQIAKNKGLLPGETLELWIHQIRETLFDGMAVDIWRNSSREIQKSFFNKYLSKMIENESPVLNDVNDFVVNLYDKGVLTSKTFEKVEKQSRKILNEIRTKFSETGLTTEQQKIVNMLEKDLFSGEGILVSMRQQYLNNLTLRSDGVTDGLFTQQMQSVSDYMTRYGVSNEVMLNNIKNMQPRIEYIGQKNIGVIFGESNQEQITKVLDMISHSELKTKRFLTSLQEQFAAAKNPTSSYIKYFFKDFFSSVRRWSIARMLGGAYFDPSLKFFGTNRVTAAYLYFAALGSGKMKVRTAAKFVALSGSMGIFTGPVARKVIRGLGRKSFTGFIDSNKVMVAPADEVIIRQSDGAIRDFTAGEIRESMIKNGVSFSRSDADFMDTEWTRFLIDSQLTPDGVARYGFGHTKNFAKKVIDNLSPSGKNFWAEFNKIQDTEMRRYIFFESLKDGENILQASEKARRSMLDYGSLTGFEKRHVSKYIYFYSFMRTMGVETINAMYRSILSDVANPSLGLLKVQARLNTETEDRAMQVQQDSRIFNIFTESTEGTDYYAGGPVNPSISMFELMSSSFLVMAGSIKSLTNEERQTEERLLRAVSDAMIYSTSKSAFIASQGNPFLGLIVEGYRAHQSGRPIPFPSELINQAEKNGNLEEVIKLYNLAPRDPTPGRPLSSTGKYYSFARTKKGMSGYLNYLLHRAIGLTAFSEVASRSGIAPAAMTRMNKEMLRASMFAAEDMTMPSPTGEGEVSIPTESVYLKSLNKQDLDVYRDFAYGLYMFGLLTPVKATKKNVMMERLLRNTLSEIKDIEERTQQEK
jgi:hypothetical protein